MTWARHLMLLASASLMATGALAMDLAEYNTARQRIGADTKVRLEKCRPLSGNARDVCAKEARVAQVEERAGDTPAAKSAAVVQARKDAAAERRKADFDAAKARCDALSGDLQSKCVADARRVYAP